MPGPAQVSGPGQVPRPGRVSEPGTHWVVPDPERLALGIRLRAVQMVAPHGFGYLGQALSSAEQVAALFAVARPGPGPHRLLARPLRDRAVRGRG